MGNSLDYNYADLVGGGKAAYYETVFGVEVECEGDRLPPAIPEFWRATRDGSLRGNALEYVFLQPLSFDDSMKAIDHLWEQFDKKKTRLAMSYRTSVHVHVNVGHWPMRKVLSLFCLYVAFEDLLCKFCGDTRSGNLFCLRAKDAKAVVAAVEHAVNKSAWANLASDNYRYAAFNFAALQKYGSIEFRAMRGTDKKEDVKRWVSIIDQLVKAVENYPTPVSVVMQLSQLGPVEFCNRVFGKYAEELLAPYPNMLEVEDSIYDNIRVIQGLAFGCNVKDEKEGVAPRKYVPFDEEGDKPWHGLVWYHQGNRIWLDQNGNAIPRELRAFVDQRWAAAVALDPGRPLPIWQKRDELPPLPINYPGKPKKKVMFQNLRPVGRPLRNPFDPPEPAAAPAHAILDELAAQVRQPRRPEAPIPWNNALEPDEDDEPDDNDDDDIDIDDLDLDDDPEI